MKIIPDLSRVVARILVLLGLLGYYPLVSMAAMSSFVYSQHDELNFVWFLHMVGYVFLSNYFLFVVSAILLIVGIVNLRRHNF